MALEEDLEASLDPTKACELWMQELEDDLQFIRLAGTPKNHLSAARVMRVTARSIRLLREQIQEEARIPDDDPTGTHPGPSSE